MNAITALSIVSAIQSVLIAWLSIKWYKQGGQILILEKKTKDLVVE